MTEYWPGFVIKLNFVCKNATGHVDQKSDNDCVILKNVGFTPCKYYDTLVYVQFYVKSFIR